MVKSQRLSGLERAVRAAGRLALDRFGNVRGERKADHTLVSEADREVERLLVAELRRLEPEAHVLGEEGTAREERAPGQATWAVDPIDGTAVFLAGLPTWSVSVGLIRDGSLELGAVFLPLSGECFLAEGDGPLWCNGAAVDRRQEAGAFAAGLDPEAWICVPSNHHRRYRISFPAKLRSLGSTAAHFCWTARGAAVAAVSGGKLWDLAGALACCQAAGVAFCYLSGAPVELEELSEGEWTPEPVVAAHPRDIEKVRACIGLRPRT